MKFANGYGSVSLSRVSESMPIDSVFGRSLSDEYKFDIETAEKLALITDNRGIQISPVQVGGKWRCYVVLHDSPSMVAFAKIENMNYLGKNPAAEIQAARIDRNYYSY